MAKKPTKAAKADETEAAPAPIDSRVVHKALSEFQNAAAHFETVGRPSRDRAQAALTHLGAVSGLGNQLEACGSPAEVTARVKAVLAEG